MYPTDRRYSKEHEWVLVEDGSATIGITQFAQGELGDIVYVELPETGKAVNAGEVLGTIESVKAVSEIYAPIGGTVAAVNDALTEAPEQVNGDPHGSGWYCKIAVADTAEVEALMDAAAYDQHIAS
jgi:glycine cleavage system H protein